MYLIENAGFAFAQLLNDDGCLISVDDELETFSRVNIVALQHADEVSDQFKGKVGEVKARNVVCGQQVALYGANRLDPF